MLTTSFIGSQTLSEAFKNSCNCVFVNLALRLGVEKYYQYLNYFGLGEKTGVDIYSESAGIIMPKEGVRTVDLARIGFGHAVAVTQLQLATVYGKITGGQNFVPHLLSKITFDGKTLYANSNAKTDINLKADTIETINNLLFNNVNSDGKMSFVAGYSVGGKTGTAQKYGADGKIASGKYISSFVGTYPTYNPKYIILICVNEPSAGAYYGGVVAKPVGQRILQAIFETKAIRPDDESQLTLKPTIEMPNLVGKTIEEAAAELKAIGLEFVCDTDGEIIIAQLPPAGTMLYLGEVIQLITG